MFFSPHLIAFSCIFLCVNSAKFDFDENSPEFKDFQIPPSIEDTFVRRGKFNQSQDFLFHCKREELIIMEALQTPTNFLNLCTLNYSNPPYPVAVQIEHYLTAQSTCSIKLTR